MNTVILRSVDRGIRNRGDTVEFSASKYLGPEVKKVEDLLAHMEGFTLSPDGKISFNGKELEKILINGEDMAGSDYQLLSHHLRAGLIEKVQLIMNYNEDRLMRKVSHSGKVGINLKVHDSLLHQLSGGLEYGATLSGRRLAGFHVLKMDGKLKTIGSIRFNETGERDAGSMLDENGDGHGGHAGVGMSGLLAQMGSGTFHTTILPASYTRNNHDAIGSVSLNMPLGNGTKAHFKIGAGRTNRSQKINALEIYSMPDRSDWFLNSRQESFQKNSLVDVTLGLEHDRMKGNRGDVAVVVSGALLRGSLNRQTSGILEDSMNELKRDQIKGVTLRGTESFRLGKGVLRTEYEANMRIDNLILADLTQRYASFFGLDTTYQGILQQLKTRAADKKISLSYLTNHRGHEWRAGVRSKGGVDQLWAASKFTGLTDSTLYPKQKSSTGFHSLTMFTDLSIDLGRRSRLAFSMEGGMGGVDGSGRYGHSINSLIYDFGIGYEKFFNPFQGVSITYKTCRHLQDLCYALPLPLFSGNATIMEPSELKGPRSQHQLNLSFHSRSISSGVGMFLQMKYGMSVKEQNWATVFDPRINLLTPFTSTRTEQLLMAFSLERYIPAMSMKWIMEGNHTFSSGDISLNHATLVKKFINNGLGVKALSGWKGKLNIEVAFHWEQNRISLNENVTRTQSNTTSLYRLDLKIKYPIGNRIYLASVISWYHAPDRSDLPAWGLHFSWKPSSIVEFALDGHNLLNIREFGEMDLFQGVSSFRSYVLVPRYVMFRVSIDF